MGEPTNAEYESQIVTVERWFFGNHAACTRCRWEVFLGNRARVVGLASRHATTHMGGKGASENE